MIPFWLGGPTCHRAVTRRCSLSSLFLPILFLHPARLYIYIVYMYIHIYLYLYLYVYIYSQRYNATRCAVARYRFAAENDCECVHRIIVERLNAVRNWFNEGIPAASFSPVMGWFMAVRITR